MRRMPVERRLAALVGTGEPVHQPLRALARQLAALHARSERSAAITAAGSATALTGRWSALLDQLDGLVPDGARRRALITIRRFALDFVAGRARLFADRCAEGRVVDGHGDLIADDVFCLPDGPRALDCLEFDDTLRQLDGLDDAAFLAMDLERLGRPDLGRRFLDDYAEFAADPAPASLRHHYIAYRSCVRALVQQLRASQGNAPAAELAGQHAELTLRHLRAGAVRLVLVGGLPGTGKSTLAAALADRVGAVLLSSDRLRKDQAGLDPAEPVAADYRAGLYAPAATDRVYSALLERAEAALRRGEHVVLDASWTDAAHRQWASELAERSHTNLLPLRCDVPRQVALNRIRHRHPGPSDATPAIYTAMATAADAWPQAITVRTDEGVVDSLRAVLRGWDEVVGDEWAR
jgi:predicted kinase